MCGYGLQGREDASEELPTHHGGISYGKAGTRMGDHDATVTTHNSHKESYNAHICDPESHRRPE
jgi:hypothetical protein